MSTHALGTSEPRAALRASRHLDLVLLALALPVFVLGELPLLGYAAVTAAWLVQRALRAALERRAGAADDPRAAAGLTGASVIGRAWLLAIAIFAAGLADREAGLAAALLAVLVFTVHFAAVLAARPLGSAAR